MKIATKSQAENGVDNSTVMTPLRVKQSINANASGGGTSNYNNLTNKPKINGVELSGNKTSSDLGIVGSGDMLKSVYDTNNSGVVDNSEKVNNHTVLTDVPANAVFTDTVYDDTAITNLANSKYTKPVNGIPKTDLESAVQTSLGKADTAIQSSDLATVATSGDYSDLSNTPTIPTKTSDLTNDSGYVTTDTTYTLQQGVGSEVNTLYLVDNNGAMSIVEVEDTTYDPATTTADGLMSSTDKSKLDNIAAGAEVNVQSDWNQTNSASDDYIKNKPTIPTVNNATLTIKKNNTSVGTFTANSSTDTTVDITVPTATSDLTNDSSYVSDSSYVHTDNNYTTTEKTKLSGIAAGAEQNVQSDWNESDSASDAYIANKPTIPTVPTNISAFTNDVGYLTSESDPVFSASAASTITSNDISSWTAKQEALVSGTNIKTINNQSLLGSGNITVGGGGTATDVQINGTSITSSNVANIVTESAYNATTNKIATMSDMPTVPTKTSDLTNDGSSGSNYYAVTNQPNTGMNGYRLYDQTTSSYIYNFNPCYDGTELNDSFMMASDLVDYVQKTQYATNNTAGLVKVQTGYGISANSGILFARNLSYSDYSSAVDNAFISKGTLENVITGKSLAVTNADNNFSVGQTITGNLDVNGNYKIKGTEVLYYDTTDKYVILAANVGNIYFRPNGMWNSSGQAYIDTSGKVKLNGVLEVNDELKVIKSGKTVTIGSQNASYCHYNTDAPQHWFNKPVAVQGDVYGGANYNRRLAYYDEIPGTSVKNLLKISLASDYTISSSGEKKLTLATNDFQQGSSLSIDSGGIKIGSGITKVKVSGNIYFGSGTSAGDSLRVAIKKNSTTVGMGYARAGSSGTYETRNVVPIPITVTEGDIIYIYANNATAGRGKVTAGSTNTYLIVEEI